MKTRAFLYIVIAGILWGTSGIFVHYLAPLGFSSLQMTAVRSLVAALAMWVYMLLRNRHLIRVSPKQLLLFSLGGICYLGTAASYYAAMQASSISTAVVLMYTAPVIVMVYSVAFMGERLTALKAVSVAAMLVGCCLVSGIIGGLSFSPLGIGLGLLSGVSYSAYNIVTKIQMSRGDHPMSVVLWCFTAASFVAVCFSNPPAFIALTVQNYATALPLFLGSGIVTCILPYFLYTLSLKSLPVGTATALGIVEPMAATIFSVVLFHEPLSPASGCGIVLILGAVLLLSRERE